MEGSGRMVVTAVGINSIRGSILRMLGATEEQKEGKSCRSSFHTDRFMDSIGKNAVLMRQTRFFQLIPESLSGLIN